MIYIFVFEFLSIIKCSSSFQILEHLAGKTGYGTVCSRFPDDINSNVGKSYKLRTPQSIGFKRNAKGDRAVE